MLAHRFRLSIVKLWTSQLSFLVNLPMEGVNQHRSFLLAPFRGWRWRLCTSFFDFIVDRNSKIFPDLTFCLFLRLVALEALCSLIRLVYFLRCQNFVIEDSAFVASSDKCPIHRLQVVCFAQMVHCVVSRFLLIHWNDSSSERIFNYYGVKKLLTNLHVPRAEFCFWYHPHCQFHVLFISRCNHLWAYHHDHMPYRNWFLAAKAKSYGYCDNLLPVSSLTEIGSILYWYIFIQ